MVAKNNVMRLLESRSIPYQAHTYGDASEFRTAEEVANLVGAPYEQVFKTLVILREKGRPLLVMIPADRELDLRLFARSIGEKKVSMAAQRQAESLTGLQVGGISALALLNKGFDVYMDRNAMQLPRIYVSAGQRGMQVELAVADLINITGAQVVDATSVTNRQSPVAGADN